MDHLRDGGEEGFLTPTERAVLRGEYDGDANAISTHRERLRKKTKAALLDLALFARESTETDRENVLHRDTPTTTLPTVGRIPALEDYDGEPLWGGAGATGALADVVALLALTLREADADREDVSAFVESALERAEGEFRHGVVGWRKRDVRATVDIEVVDDVNVARARERLKSAQEHLSPMEAKALLETGDLEPANE